MIQTVETEKYHKVEVELTAKELMEAGNNPLLLAIRVSSMQLGLGCSYYCNTEYMNKRTPDERVYESELKVTEHSFPGYRC